MLRFAVAATLLAGIAAAAPLPVVDWREAGTRVGDVVTVEGDVTTVRMRDDGYVLEFADDPQALRIVVLIPLLGGAPRDPERVYRGHHVRATGRVQRFQGRPEIVLRSPSQVEITDVPAAAETELEIPTPPPPAEPRPTPRAPVAAPATAAPPVAPPAASRPPAQAPAAAAAPQAEPPAPVEPPQPPRPIERPLGDASPCERARAEWRDTGADVRARLVALARCIDRVDYHCARERASLTSALDALDAHEQAVDAACR